MKSIIGIISFLFLISACSQNVYLRDISSQERHVIFRVLHSNDTHGMILPFDYIPLGQTIATKKNVGGLARRAWLINQYRSRA